MCAITRGIKYIGGIKQLFSPDQEIVNASALDVPGHQYLELNFSIFVFSLFANLSIVIFPHISDIF